MRLQREVPVHLRFCRRSPVQYSCNTDSSLFEFWFENHLFPSIPDNSVIVLDNASFHNKSRLSTLISHSNKKIVFLPPYSPDLNPIEKFWANLKSFLRFSLSSFASGCTEFLNRNHS